MSDTQRSFSVHAQWRRWSERYALENPECPYAGSYAKEEPFRSYKHDHRDGQPLEKYLHKASPGNTVGICWQTSNAFSKRLFQRKERRLRARELKDELEAMRTETECPACDALGDECESCERDRKLWEAFEEMWTDW